MPALNLRTWWTASSAAAAPPGTGSPAPGAPDGRFDKHIDKHLDSDIDSGVDHDLPRQGFGWRRRALVLAALLGCLALFSLSRWLATTPELDGTWAAGPAGELLLQTSTVPALNARRGQTVLAISTPGAAPLAVDALLLHRWPRWQVDDGVRVRQVAQHEQLARMLAAGPRSLQLHFADGSQGAAPVAPRGYAGLGLFFWPLAALALLLYLCAVVLITARPQPYNLLFVAMALCQAGNLLFIAMESTPCIGLPVGMLARDLAVRVSFDLCTAAAAVQAFALHPTRYRHATAVSAAAWAVLPAWWLLAWAPNGLPLWWLAQLSFIVMGVAALALAHHSHRLEPNPYALMMRRLAAASVTTLALVTVAVALAAGRPATAAAVAAGASITWYLFLASLLLLTPFLARSRQLLREFALLAGVSTVATSLDLLFAAVFSLGTFTSLALAIFIGVGLYAAARQWALNHLIGSSVATTERTFDHLYRAAREVQAHPKRYPQLLARLLRDLFDPLEVLSVDRVPVRSRLVGGGSVLVVPVRNADDDDGGTGTPPHVALALRFAQRGQRLFTLEDARLADRLVDQLRRAVAYDAAVERGRFEERQRIAQDLHDDIGARLLTLMYQAQTREMEDYIRHTLLDLKTLTRGLAVAEHRFSHAAAEWKADLTQRLTVSQVALNWSFDVDDDPSLSVVQWSALTRVLRELVTNALYHGHATSIDVAFRLRGSLLTLQVVDDGRGRAPEVWAHGLGLGGVRKRVKVLGGEVTWRENGERGIVCSVRLPRFSAYH